jgi:nicotinate-nucleotide adenylyltransferase
MGGTFNPVHLGHLRAAEELAALLRLDRVLFIPAASHPHKGAGEMAPFVDRFRMVEMAVAGRPGFEASDIEARLPVPSYTVNTLATLRDGLPEGGELFFLVGFDSFRAIKLWKSYRELFRLASFVVNVRPETPGSRALLGEILQSCFGGGPRWDPREGAFLLPGLRPVHYSESSRLAISSTDLRARLAAGESIRYLVPEPVLGYLLSRGLYSRGAGGPPG